MNAARSLRPYVGKSWALKIGTIIVSIASATGAVRAEEDPIFAALLSGKLTWTASGPLLGPEAGRPDACHAIKDPTIVRHNDRWHVFATIKCRSRTQMEQLSFADWDQADRAPRHVITLVEAYHCAPQVFYFRPHKKWYLIYQWSDPTRNAFGPGFSTLDDPSRPESLSRPAFLYPDKPDGVQGWLDFWIICDDSRAHLFFTSLDGRMWRADTPLAQFPRGWNSPKVVLQADIFEASHTYRLKGRTEYLTIVEAQGPAGTRYYKSYLADRLDGNWRPLADSFQRPFAGSKNMRFPDGVQPWTDVVSHGELIREGYDETMTVDPRRLQFVIQGCTSSERAGKGYGQFPWRIGVLTATAP